MARTCALPRPCERRKESTASGLSAEVRCENRGAAFAANSGGRPQMETRYSAMKCGFVSRVEKRRWTEE
jgi:hypothetical protein